MVQGVGYEDEYRGWYDTRGCGACNDYCRWTGDGGPGDDPFLMTVKHAGASSFWTCQLPDIEKVDYEKEGVFLYKKCTGRGARPPRTRNKGIGRQ